LFLSVEDADEDEDVEEDEDEDDDTDARSDTTDDEIGWVTHRTNTLSVRRICVDTRSASKSSSSEHTLTRSLSSSSYERLRESGSRRVDEVVLISLTSAVCCSTIVRASVRSSSNARDGCVCRVRRRSWSLYWSLMGVGETLSMLLALLFVNSVAVGVVVMVVVVGGQQRLLPLSLLF